MVEVWDGTTWHNVGEVDNTGTGIDSVDFSSYASEIYKVRLTDTTNPGIHNDNADGFDIDAVSTTVCEDVNSFVGGNALDASIN